jgi:hypothetical protein
LKCLTTSCTAMLYPNSTTKARKSVTKHHFIICADWDATPANWLPSNREQTGNLELAQKHAWWSATYMTQCHCGEFGIQSTTL